jgi:hypothetical protein
MDFESLGNDDPLYSQMLQSYDYMVFISAAIKALDQIGRSK